MLNDLVLALRRAAKTPLSTTLAVATLALALGANSAVLSIADAVLFRPLPYAQPERLCFLTVVLACASWRQRFGPAAVAVATALLSAYIPARRAGRLDPTVLLRVE